MGGLVQQMRYTFWALANPRYLNPTAAIESFDQLTVPPGIRVVVLDKDNTFSKPHDLEVWPKFQARWDQLLNNAKTQNYECVILSNTAGDASADPTGELASELERNLQVAVLRHKLKKPMCYKELEENYAKRGVSPAEMLVVGDRLVTDILMANLIGAKSVWIAPGVHPNFYNKAENYIYGKKK